MAGKGQSHQCCVLVVRLAGSMQPGDVPAGVDAAVRSSLALMQPGAIGSDEPPGFSAVDAFADVESLGRQYLDAAEHNAALRIREPATREAFAGAHAGLRIVLGHACGIDPRDVPIDRTANGKPFVPLGGAPHFSLAHARGVFAIAWGNVPMGVDIERAAGLRGALSEDMGAIASRYFSEGEQLQLEAAGPGERTHAFLQIWTRKEALVKAAGATLEALVGIDTVKSPLVTLDDAGAYCVHSLPVGTGYHLAFAARAATPTP